ncbi:phosphoribosylformylglycinamidine synthase I [Pyrolobus fumarii]|uniref:phosphoribosylformylglycinamidine synthase I n=1 Tax=Pyrolobus fumarii TaxID=54252 RepID=UPI001FCCB4C9|nr:phosphoribosylformylglycinamidine synthase I [Pyrolobus fumarii]
MAIVKFPGTNCERETLEAVRRVARLDALIVRHDEFDWRAWDALIIPGGFSYGDYVRAGVMATWSKFSEALREGVENGLPVLGICNGFQVLTEAGVLPGVLLPNECGCFVARWVRLRIAEPKGPWLGGYEDGEIVWMPVAHGEGRWWGLEEPRGPSLRYVDNPNGSRWDIAGVSVRDGQVVGMMPHPERAAFPWQAPAGRNPGGLKLFEWLGKALRAGW